MTKDINDNINSTSAKYEVHSTFIVKGVVEVQDIVGALFGQTEGLLDELELRELQKSGRVGRIVVNSHSKNGLTKGDVIIPSSLDKTETAILAATLETVERVGPCSAQFQLQEIKDLRQSKLAQIEKRAKELLKDWKGLGAEQDLTEKITEELEKDQIIKWKGLDAGVDFVTADEVIIVEGRNDIQQLLKIGVKNTIAVNGTSIPKAIIELTKKKDCTAFMDGDRGGKIILNELVQVSDVKYYAFAPGKKEVEELHPKDLVKALQNKRPISDYLKEKKRHSKHAKSKRSSKPSRSSNHKSRGGSTKSKRSKSSRSQKSSKSKKKSTTRKKSSSDKGDHRSKRRYEIPKKFGTYVKDLISSNKAIGLDKQDKKVLEASNVEFLNKLNGNVDTVIIDGVVNQRFLEEVENKKINTVIAVNFQKNLHFKNPRSINLYYFSDFV